MSRRISPLGILLPLVFSATVQAQIFVGPGPDPACGGTELKVIERDRKVVLIQQTYFASNRTLVDQFRRLPHDEWEVTLMLYSSRWKLDEPLTKSRLVQTATFKSSDLAAAARQAGNFGSGAIEWEKEPARLIAYFNGARTEFEKDPKPRPRVTRQDRARRRTEEAEKDRKIAEAEARLNSTSLDKVLEDQSAFEGRRFTILGVVNVSSYYNYQFYDRQSDMYAFVLSEGGGQSYFYAPRIDPEARELHDKIVQQGPMTASVVLMVEKDSSGRPYPSTLFMRFCGVWTSDQGDDGRRRLEQIVARGH